MSGIEIIFEVSEDEVDGGYTASALGSRSGQTTLHHSAWEDAPK